jgi:copper chaperone CopZ
MLVDMTLTELDGVVESKTDHATGLSAVVFDDERVSVPQLITAIQSAGYDAELLS